MHKIGGPAQVKIIIHTHTCTGAGVSAFHEVRCLCMMTLQVMDLPLLIWQYRKLHAQCKFGVVIYLLLCPNQSFQAQLHAWLSHTHINGHGNMYSNQSVLFPYLVLKWSNLSNKQTLTQTHKHQQYVRKATSQPMQHMNMKVQEEVAYLLGKPPPWPTQCMAYQAHQT